MLKEKTTIDNLFHGAKLSDPLKTYKENVDTIKNLVELSTQAVAKRTATILEGIKSLEQSQKDQLAKIAEETKRMKKHEKELKEQSMWNAHLRWGKPDLLEKYRELKKDKEALTEDMRKLISERKVYLASLDIFISNQQERYKSSLESSKRELPALMQMAFIYLVAVWDAFILDTTRVILRIHPELISKSENKTDLTKSDLWYLGSTEELREFLIELEIRRLDSDRKKLTETFNSYWGIDWGDSGVPIDTIVEIRARRDLWVHNRGRVNAQYLKMVNSQTLLNLNALAEVDRQYFTKSLFTLTKLAVYIHKLADEKHYSKPA